MLTKKRHEVFLTILLGFFVTSCSMTQKVEEETNTTNQVVPLGQESLVATDFKSVAKASSGSIAGSSVVTDQFNRNTYFLYGAEHLKLENYYFDIPVVYNAEVKKWMEYFLNRGRGFFERYGARAGRYAPIMGTILEKQGMPRDLIFLAMAESGFQTKARSWARAVGPWQFMPYTGKRFGLKIDWYIDERRDPFKATLAAAAYLKKLYADFQSWELAAAAYNAGEGKMDRAIRKYKTDSFWKLTKGKYLKGETKNYVPKIMALAIIGKNLKSFGFEDIDFHEPLDFEEIIVPPMTDLYKVADIIGTEFDEIHYLNPEIVRWFTPPGQEYRLRIPVDLKASWPSEVANDDIIAKDFQVYQVKGRQSSLQDVAKRFRIDPNVLEFFNSMNKNQMVQKDQNVILPFRIGHKLKEEMYADLYEKPRKTVVRRKMYRNWISKAKVKGTKITNPTRFYVVKKGDTLWEVAKKTGTSLETLIVSNYGIIKNRMIREGDKLVVR